MHLRLKECGKKDIQLEIIFGLGMGGDFEGGKGNPFVVLVKVYVFNRPLCMTPRSKSQGRPKST